MNLKLTLRHLTKDRKNFIINLLGMVLSFTLVLVLLSHALYSLQTDRHIPESEKVGAISLSPNMLFMPYPSGGLLRDNFSSIKDITIIDYLYAEGGQVLQDAQQRNFSVDLVKATEGFFGVFGIESIRGELEGLLQKPGALALTRSEAKRIFGEEDPLGKTLTYRGDQLRVEALLPDIPPNSTTAYGGVLAFATDDLHDAGRSYTNDWSRSNYHIFARFSDPGAMEETERGIPAMMVAEDRAEDPGEYAQARVIPLPELYFTRHLRDFLPHGNKNNILLMITAALAILVVAVLNYINLATAQSAKRIRTIGIRKVTGASRLQLMKSVFAESTLMALLSGALALALAAFIVHLSNRSGYFMMSPLLTAHWKGWLLVLAGTLLLGIVSGIYPSLQFTRFNPVKTMRLQNNTNSGGGSLRNILTVTQFTIAILLIIFTLLVKKQNHYLLNHDPGFNRESILCLDTYRGTLDANLELLKQELLKLPEITRVSGVSSNLGELEEHWGTTMDYSQGEKSISFFTVIAERDYPEVMGLELVRGGNGGDISNPDVSVVYFNEKAYEEFEMLPEDVGSAKINAYYTVVDHPANGQVVGILKDFNYHTYHKEIRPMALLCSDGYNNLGSMVLRFRAGGLQNTRELIARVQEVWERMEYGVPFSYVFLDDHLAQMYAEEIRFNQVFTAFVVLAIFIACLGILGLSAFIAEQRRKEIAIRKVNGATVSTVLQLLTRRFLVHILLAFTLAAPLAYFVAGRWLQNYAYHTDRSWYLWLAALVMSLSVALATAWTYTYRAATKNPAESLKYE